MTPKNYFLKRRRGQGRVTANFPTPPLFEASARGNPLDCRNEIWRQKTRIVGLPDGEELEEIITLAFFVLTEYRRVTDRQIDGQTRYERYYPR